MGFTAWRTWVTGEVVTASQMNQQIRDNGDYVSSLLGHAEISADQAGLGPSSDIAGLSVGISVDGSRRIAADVHVPLINNTAAGELWAVQILDNGAVVQERWYSSVASTSFSGLIRASYKPTAGAHTIKAHIARSTGAGTATWGAAATRPSYIDVKDTGSL